MRRFVVDLADASHHREIDGFWDDAVGAIRAEFGALHIRKVSLILPEGRPVDVTAQFTVLDHCGPEPGRVEPYNCLVCGLARFHDGRCIACGTSVPGSRAPGSCPAAAGMDLKRGPEATPDQRDD